MMQVHGILVRLTPTEMAWLRAFSPDVSGAAANSAADPVPSWLSSEDGRQFDLESALPGVHFLLAGDGGDNAGVLDFLGNIERGAAVAYPFSGGPGRVISPESVAAIARAIETIPARVVHQRLASDVLKSIYPFGGKALEDDDKEWLLAVLHGLMTFLRASAMAGASVLVAWQDPAADPGT